MKKNTNEQFRLREYKGYNLVDAGPVENGDPGDCKLEIQTLTNELHDVKHTIYFNNSQPENLNKAIERAKEWVNAQEKKEEPAGDQPPRYSDEDLSFFKDIIDKKLDAARKELEYLDGLIKKHEDPDRQPSDPIHTDQEVEQFGLMRERQNTFIGHLEAALTRIENKTYGVCRVTGKLIDKARLTAVPHATLSIEAKKMANKETAPTPDLPKKKSRSKKAAASTDVKPEEKKEQAKLRTCRVCGCTENNCEQCIKKTGKPCYWIEEDLCSACVEDPKIEVKDERAAHASETENDDNNNSSPNTNDMTFFQQLVAIGKVDMTLRIMQVGDKLQLGIFPKGKMTQPPVNITGTAEELDEGFTKTLQELKTVPGYVTNLEEVKKAADEKPAEVKSKEKTTAPKKQNKKSPPKKSSKPAAKKAQIKKPVVKKPAVKPGPKPKPGPKTKAAKPAVKKATPAPKVEEPFVEKEPSLFDTATA